MGLSLNVAGVGYVVYGLLYGFNIGWKGFSFLAFFVFACSSVFPYLLMIYGDRLMDMFVHHWRVYVYNVSWEDPRVDNDVMHPGEKDNILTIASAGCNVFDYLISGSRVTAVDMNPSQLALTEIRAKAVELLPWETVFDMYAKNNMELFHEKYHDTLRDKVTPRCRDFWDSKMVNGKCKMRTFLYSGTSGWTAYIVFRYLFPACGLGWLRKALLDKMPKEEIRAKFNKVSGCSPQPSRPSCLLPCHTRAAFARFAASFVSARQHSEQISLRCGAASFRRRR